MSVLKLIFILLCVVTFFACDNNSAQPVTKNADPETNEVTIDNTSNDDPVNTTTSIFPADFISAVDSAGLGQGSAIQGWGGSGAISKTPIIFIHGNGNDADAFKKLAALFINEAGYNDSELWAFSYQGYPNKSANEPFGTGENNLNNMTTPHTNAVDDVNTMINAIMNYTGATKVIIIAHSLGVTLTRHYLKKYNAYNKIKSFVGIAGANHGMSGVESIEPEWTAASISTLCLHASGDETPYGSAPDSINHLASTNETAIQWIVVHGDDEDYIVNYDPSIFKLVNNTASPLLDGADVTINLKGKYSNPDSKYGIHFLYLSEPEILFNAIKDYVK